MELVTYSAIKTKLYDDLDLYDEDFITESEFLGLLNEGINDAESIIHNLGLEARYFKTTDTLTLVSGTADYSMPSDVYANKLYRVFYINGSQKYRVDRIRNMDEVLDFDGTQGGGYKYDILNLTAGVKQRFYPTPAESGAYIQRYYIRNIRALTTSTASTNTCELPECVNFLYAHVRMRVYQKEGNPLLAKAMDDLKLQHDLMVQNLQEMVPDENNQIIPDVSFYEDASNNYWGI